MAVADSGCEILSIEELLALKLHDKDLIEGPLDDPNDPDCTEVMRVYGGWIYIFINKVDHRDYVFVPYPNAPELSIKG
jgi:hypothetical protein